MSEYIRPNPELVQVDPGERFSLPQSLRFNPLPENANPVAVLPIEVRGISRGEVNVWANRDVIDLSYQARTPLGPVNITFIQDNNSLNALPHASPWEIAMQLYRVPESLYKRISCSLIIQGNEYKSTAFKPSSEDISADGRILYRTDKWEKSESEGPVYLWFPRSPQFIKDSVQCAVTLT